MRWAPGVRSIIPEGDKHAEPLLSPAYDGGQTETAITARWRTYWEQLWRLREPASAPG